MAQTRSTKINTKALLGGICALALGASHALADESGSKSGAFVGAELGMMSNFASSQPLPQAGQGNQGEGSTTKTTTYPFGAIGLKAGYAHYFNNSFGLRAYGAYNYGFNGSNNTTTTTEGGGGQGGGATTTTEKANALTSLHQVSANIDVIWDFLQLSSTSLGVYAGIGAGYAAHTSSSTTTEGAATTTTDTNMGSGFVLPVNLGLELGIGKHHRAGLNFKIPTLPATFKNNVGAAADNNEYKSRNLIISVSYAYVF